MGGGKIGGINVFGGGFALYNQGGEIVGGLGVSGDSSCADHNIGWRTRQALGLDYVPKGVSGDPKRPDNIVYDITPQAGQQEGSARAAGAIQVQRRGEHGCSRPSGDSPALSEIGAATQHSVAPGP